MYVPAQQCAPADTAGGKGRYIFHAYLLSTGTRPLMIFSVRTSECFVRTFAVCILIDRPSHSLTEKKNFLGTLRKDHLVRERGI